MSGVGIVGCGFISKAYAQKLNALDFVDLVACADLERERAEKLANEMEIPKVASPQELIADADVDVVLNLTVPAAHAEVSRAASLEEARDRVPHLR